MMEISNNLADCIMPNDEQINYFELTTTWTRKYCQGYMVPADETIPAPTQTLPFRTVENKKMPEL
jgi:hypothetical protein